MSAQIATSFSEFEQASRAWQQTEHDEAKTEMVGLCQRVKTSQRVGEAQQPHCASEKEKGVSADRDDTENFKNENSSAARPRGIIRLRRRAAVYEGDGSEGGEGASPRATSSTPRTPVAEATSRSEVILPMPRSCAAIMGSAFEGPVTMRTKPTATVNRMKPAAASRKSAKAERPDEQGLFRRQIGRNGPVNIEAVDKERPIFVGPCWQRSRQQTGQSAERAPPGIFGF